jgi:hypothetical protein
MRFADITVVPGPCYTYRVRSRDAVGKSEPSNTVRFCTLHAPTNLGGWAQYVGVRLWWDENSPHATEYVVERTLEAAGEFVEIPVNRFVPRDDTAELGTCYWYRVKARNVRGTSEYSETVKICTASFPPTPLGLTGALDPNERVVYLAWVDTYVGDTGFVVERAADGENYIVLGETHGGETAFADITVVPGKRYTYRVRTKYGNWVSAPSNEVALPTLQSPSGLTGAPAADGRAVFLAWADNSAHETKYEIERALDGGAFAWLGETRVDGAAFADITVTPGTCYQYRVRARNNAGDSEYSAPVRICTP